MRASLILILTLCNCTGGDDVSAPDAEVGAFCGDHVCNGGESCASCPGDCGGCAETCSSADPTSCSGENICVAGTCTSAWGRTYRIRVTELVVSTTNQEGDSWDTLGGAPDPYVEVTIAGALAYSTTENPDTFAPNFANFADVVLASGQNWGIAAWDADLAEPDNIIYCTLEPLTAVYLRYRGVVCEGSAATGTQGTRLELGIEPR